MSETQRQFDELEDDRNEWRTEAETLRARLAEAERERDEAVDASRRVTEIALPIWEAEVAEVAKDRDAAIQRAEQAEARLAELIQIGDDVAHAVSDWSDGDDSALDRVEAKHGDRREVLRVETIRDAVSKAEKTTISAIAHWVRKERHVEPLVTNYLADCIENGAWRSKEGA